MMTLISYIDNHLCRIYIGVTFNQIMRDNNLFFTMMFASNYCTFCLEI